eukprot:jgi/Tetstr1/436400/TSEL_025231.t1
MASENGTHFAEQLGLQPARDRTATTSARHIPEDGLGPLLLWLLAEYPRLTWGGAILSLPVALLSILSSGRRFLVASDLWLPVTLSFWAGVAGVCVLSRQARARAQVAANQLPLNTPPVVMPNLCLSPAELHDSFERWELSDGGVAAWRVREWVSLAHMLGFHVKMWTMPGCGMASGSAGLLYYQLLFGLPTGLFAFRVFCRRALSPRAYSFLSLAVLTYVWVIHMKLLLNGDACFGGIAHEAYRGPVLLRAAMAVAAFFLMSLMTPVTRVFLPLKLGISWLGCIVTSYMHTLFREEAGGLTQEVDPGHWGFLAIFLAVSLASITNYIDSTWRTETSLRSFFRTLIIRDE